MTKIEIKDLSILFGPEKAKAKKMVKQGKSKQEILKETGCTIAVRNANLEIKEGEMFVIMGLSGSGKSTLVRCINRLNEPSMGEIWLSGRNITSLSDKELLQIRRKEMAMVFQHFGLLPHRTVLSNIAFGLELQGVPKEEREKKAYESIAVVGLKGYENQRVDELSGGMQQRVGLARALANDPEVLLMDEAFSALDPLIREQMQDELLDLQEKMKRTIVFITHDLDEAIKLGDRIAIMKDGEVVQVGTSEEGRDARRDIDRSGERLCHPFYRECGSWACRYGLFHHADSTDRCPYPQRWSGGHNPQDEGKTFVCIARDRCGRAVPW